MAADLDEQILRVSKEIVVKFIETGRVSPASFHENFQSIYKSVLETVRGEETAGEVVSPPQT